MPNSFECLQHSFVTYADYLIVTVSSQLQYSDIIRSVDDNKETPLPTANLFRKKSDSSYCMLKIHFTFRRILCLWEKLSHVACDLTGDRKLFSWWFPLASHALTQKCQEMQEIDSFQWLYSSSVIANSCTGTSLCQKPSRTLSEKIVREFLRYSFHFLDFHSIVSMPASNFSKQRQAISSNSYCFNFPVPF